MSELADNMLSSISAIGKKRRLTIIECGNDMNIMIDVAKSADLVKGIILLANKLISVV